MEIWIHIGWPKTGTSAIQAHITCNQGWFAEQGVYIPKSGFRSGRGHCFLFGEEDLEAQSELIQELLQKDSMLPQLTEEIRAAEDAGYQKVLLSWEGFCLLDSELIAALRDCLVSHKVTVIGYVREHITMAHSLVLQAVGSRWPANNIFSIEEDDPLLNFPFLEYDRVLDKWRREFGSALDVRTRIYSRSLFVDSDVVMDFVSWLGLEADEGFVVQNEDINISFSPYIAAHVAVAQAAGCSARAINRQIHALARAQSSAERNSKTFLPGSIRAQIRQQRARGSAQLLEAFPPENCSLQQAKDHFFDQSLLGPAVEDPSIEQLRASYQWLKSNKVETWQGNTLVGHDLSLVTDRAGAGWRGTEWSGIWSIGDTSEIAFKLPRLHPDRGPRSLTLTIQGRYFADNAATRVVWGDTRIDVDLRDGEVTVPIGDLGEPGVVHLTLTHQNPTSPRETGKGASDDRLSFMLKSIWYDFNWGE